MDTTLLINQLSAQVNLFNIKSISLKTVSVLFTACLFSGCSSLGGGSVQKRATKLSNGIQRAYAVSPNTANRVAPMIVTASEQYKVDPLLIAAMIRQESTYRSNVTSPAGAIGLTQVIPRYWQNTCQGDLFDEYNNITCGTYILTKYNESTGSWKKALAYYNVGPTGYNNNRKMKKQGKRYAKQVKQHEKSLKNAL